MKEGGREFQILIVEGKNDLEKEEVKEEEEKEDFYKTKCALETGLFSNIFDNVDHNTQRYLLRNQSSLLTG